MTRDKIKRRWQIAASKLTPVLDEKYFKAKIFPNTQTLNYEKSLHFVKGFGFKVLRNSSGKHKLIIKEEELEKDFRRHC